MYGPRVLIAYGSKNGSTAQIARWIAETLRSRGIHTVMRPAAECGDIVGYDAVIIGSGLYRGRWLREASHFVRRQRRALLRLPVWMFSSGPLDPSAAERAIPPTERVTRIADRVDAADHTTFGGRLVSGARGFTARQILAQGRGGDFRNRGQIRAWSQAVSDSVTAQWDAQPGHHLRKSRRAS